MKRLMSVSAEGTNIFYFPIKALYLKLWPWADMLQFGFLQLLLVISDAFVTNTVLIRT